MIVVDMESISQMNQNSFRPTATTFLPFGPAIYLNRVDEKYIVEMEKAKDKVIGDNEREIGDRLAGRIDDQYEILDLVSDSCKGHIFQHVNQYYFDQRGSSINQEEDGTLGLTSLWVNVQRYMEINPWHLHTGIVSFVIYIKNELNRDETINNKFDKKRGTELAGHLQLKYGESNHLNYVNYDLWPERGQIIMFPSWLMHTVFPHYEKDKERVSVAGNIIQMEPPTNPII